VAGRQLDASPCNRSLTSVSGDACAGSLTRGSRRQLRDVVSQKDFGDRREERETDHDRMATSAAVKITLNRFSGVALLGIPYSIAVAHPTADVATCRPRQRRDTTASFAKSASSESNARCRRCDQFCFRTRKRSAKSLAGCAGKMAEGPQTSAWIPRSSFIWCSNGDGVDPSPLRWSFSAFGCSPN
jgi:hypothetical protein